MTETQTPGWEAELATQYLTRVRRFVRRQNRWFRHCAAHHADHTQPFNVRLMPSKAAKHHAYSDAAQASALLGRTDRPTTFPELCALVDEPCDLTVK